LGVAADFAFEAGDGVVANAAGTMRSKSRGWVEVEGEAVGGDSAGDVNADGGDLACGARGSGETSFRG